MKARLAQRAHELGFDACRVTSAAPPDSAGYFEKWLAAGRHGEMNYLARNAPKRVEPQRVLEGARSIVTLAVSYVRRREPAVRNQGSAAHSADRREPRTTGHGLPTQGVVARYASFADYHDVLAVPLQELATFIDNLGGPGTRSLGYVDTGPLLERDLAQRAGLGFIGKHTNLISRQLGNWLFLAEIITTLELEPDMPEKNHCGTCARCITACPTAAIIAPFQLDARRCISYLTIELKGAMPLELRPLVGTRIYGCDDCLEACPWNRFARDARLMAPHARADIETPDLLELLALDEAGFRRRFAGTPILRTKRRGLLRNVCVALGNSADARALPALEKASHDPEPLIAEHALWAIEQVSQRVDVPGRPVSVRPPVVMLKRTPLFAAHQRLGGRLIEFGGWEMPVQYSSIVDEHLAVRRAGGLFDICHMGEVSVSGPAALAFLNHLLTNDAAKLAPGQGQYTLMCNEHGGVIDDLYIYRVGAEEFLLIINASRIDADVPWMERQLASWPERAHVSLKNQSDALGAVALQGPRVREFIDDVFPGPFTGGAQVAKASGLKKNEITVTSFAGQTAWIGCTGYTGEDGFEVIAPAGVIEEVWNRLLAAGHAHCLQPAGLGARDTLRTEVCYPLYGHELDENTTPIEAGVGFFVALDKGEFIGRGVLAEQKARGTAKKCIAFKMTDKSAPPRPHYPIWSSGANAAKIGEVVSGTQSPSLNIGIGLGYVPTESAKPGTLIEIEIRGRRSPAVVVAKPIYRK